MANPSHPSCLYDPSSGVKNRAPGTPLSILCVFDNPVFLDRVCRHLEKKGDISVEISVSAEDAIHLMQYVSFDVIVTDQTCWLSERNGFLKAVRGRGNHIPIIYFTQARNAEIEEEARHYGGVYFLNMAGIMPRGLDMLYQSIKHAALMSRNGHSCLY